MRVPPSLLPLLDMGIIESVVRPLMSGKEAQLYLVESGGEQRVAKVYKDASQRSFKRRDDYTDGRKVRNSRDRRAIAKGTRHGRARDEAAWRSAEVDVIYRLQAAGVRVPVPHNFMEGVLLMELVVDEQGLPAPRLGDLVFTPEQARQVYDHVIQEVVRMLCAGVVHGDLSEFNILMGADGPVIIDFPQAVDPTTNSGARRLLIRDVDNLHRFLSQVTRHPRAPYAQEMWELFERSELTPQTQLSGRFRDRRRKANTKDVLDLIGDAERDERRRRAGTGSGNDANAPRSGAPKRGRSRGSSNEGPSPKRGRSRGPNREGTSPDRERPRGQGNEPAPSKRSRSRRSGSSSGRGKGPEIIVRRSSGSGPKPATGARDRRDSGSKPTVGAKPGSSNPRPTTDETANAKPETEGGSKSRSRRRRNRNRSRNRNRGGDQATQ
ncbi:MAG: PA4780 family RIO1-like protein kinase [Myxococcota bacterium]